MPLEKIEIRTENAPPPTSPYSQALRVGELIFMSGQRPDDPETGKVVEGGIEEQTRQCILNLESVLKAAGSSLERLVRVNIYLTNPADFDGMNKVYREMIPKCYPVRTTVSCGLRNILIEMDGIAMA